MFSRAILKNVRAPFLNQLRTPLQRFSAAAVSSDKLSAADALKQAYKPKTLASIQDLLNDPKVVSEYPELLKIEASVRETFLSRNDVQESMKALEREIALGVTGVENKRTLKKGPLSPANQQVVDQIKRNLAELEHYIPGPSSERLKWYLEAAAMIVGPLCVFLAIYTFQQDAIEHAEHLLHHKREAYPYLRNMNKLIGTGSPCTLLDNECWDEWYAIQDAKAAAAQSSEH
jgi:hypothetical protein